MSNSTNASTSFSLSELIERNCVNAINVFLSILGVFGNLTVVWLIYNNPQLRKHCKYLQAALAIGDAILCSGQLTNATTNLIMANLAPKIVRWSCLLLSTHGAIAIMYSSIMTVCIAFDRFYAIVYPVKYRSIPKFPFCLSCAGLAGMISLAFAIASYTDVYLFDYPPGCIGSASRSVKMSGMINNFNALAGLVVLIVYPGTLLAITVKTRRLMRSMAPQSTNNQYFMKQVEVTASITLVVVAGLLIYVIPNLLVIILKAYNVGTAITSKAPAYIGLGSTIHCGINCIFYIWKDAKMREAFLKMIKWAPAGATVHVLPAPSSTGGVGYHHH